MPAVVPFATREPETRRVLEWPGIKVSFAATRLQGSLPPFHVPDTSREKFVLGQLEDKRQVCSESFS